MEIHKIETHPNLSMRYLLPNRRINRNLNTF